MSQKELAVDAQRSDPDAPSPEERAEKLLRESAYQEIRALKCTFCDGVLTIAGQLPSFDMNQLVLKAVRDVEGVERVENLVEVGT